MARVSWFFDDLYVPGPFSIGSCSIVPIRVPATGLQSAFQALAAKEGWTIDFERFALQETDVVALVFDNVDVASANEAEATVGPLAATVATALAYRQRGRGRSLGLLVDLGSGRVFGAQAPLPYLQVTNLAFRSERDEVIGVLQAFQDHPQGVVFADLFAQACRDLNSSAAVSRLWAILEALADRFPGGAHEQVIALLGHLTVGNPEVGDNLLTRRAYAIRNDFMHEGRVNADAWEVRDHLTELVWFVLRLCAFRAVEPRET